MLYEKVIQTFEALCSNYSSDCCYPDRSGVLRSVIAFLYFRHCQCRNPAGGIDEKIPDAIAEEEMNKLLLFVAEEDQQTVLDAYEKKESDSDYKYDGAIYVLKDSVKKMKKSQERYLTSLESRCF